MLDFLQCQGECFISFATSFDENNPPESVLEKRDSSFWITTGMFPQMLVVSLVQPTKISKIKIISSNINLLLVETSSHTEADGFELKSKMTLPYSDGHLQITEVPINDIHIRHVRLNIRSGFNHFVAVYKVLLEK
ncbi:unnamed protein product [Heterobilharzia americana]|nr:unnamed protein product [Heterobilharzia americana]CAH8580618.1 unnamed protein product [Heterobilharzia americana]